MSKRLRIADLKFDPQNARVRTAKGEAMIQESLRSVGAARSIVIDEDGTILAGNGTVEAAGQVGIENVVIVEASGDEIIAVKRVGLTDEQKKKLAYYDNRTGDEAEWDMEQVARDLLGGYEFLDELFDNIEVPAPEKEGTDELPEDPAEVLREKWGVEYGDLWQIGPHRILCGDSTKKEDVERLLDGATPSLMVTDPPYGVKYDPSWREGLGKVKGIGKVENDDNADWTEAWQLFEGNVAYVWHADRFSKTVCQSLEDAGFDPAYLLIWNKNRAPIGRGHYHHKHEPCWFVKRRGQTAEWIGGRKENTVWDIDLPHKGNETSHGTQKPLECMQRPIRNHKGDVYEPFAGSGTTMVAAHNEGRTCYALEIDPKYVAICIERMSQLGYDPDKVENDDHQ